LSTPLGIAATGLIETIIAISGAIAALKAELATLFDQHAQASIITSFPGLGPVLGARILGELGDDPHRFTDARSLRSFAGTAPITRALRRSRVVSARRICNRPGRRLPLVGLRHANPVSRRPSPLRPPQNRRRHPQRRTPQPRE
jgi:transposase